MIVTRMLWSKEVHLNGVYIRGKERVSRYLACKARSPVVAKANGSFRRGPLGYQLEPYCRDFHNYSLPRPGLMIAAQFVTSWR